MTHKSVANRPRNVNGAEMQVLHSMVGELMRRVMEGTLTFEPTKRGLQDIIEGRSEPAKKPAAADDGMAVCGVFYGNRCSICGGYFGDGDDVCANGHQIGCSY